MIQIFVFHTVNENFWVKYITSTQLFAVYTFFFGEFILADKPDARKQMDYKTILTFQ